MKKKKAFILLGIMFLVLLACDTSFFNTPTVPTETAIRVLPVLVTETVSPTVALPSETVTKVFTLAPTETPTITATSTQTTVSVMWTCEESNLVMSLIAPTIQFSEGYLNDISEKREIPALNINNVDEELIAATKAMICGNPEYFTPAYICSWAIENIYKGNIIGSEVGIKAGKQFWDYTSGIIGNSQNLPYCPEFDSSISFFDTTRWIGK